MLTDVGIWRWAAKEDKLSEDDAGGGGLPIGCSLPRRIRQGKLFGLLALLQLSFDSGFGQQGDWHYAQEEQDRLDTKVHRPIVTSDRRDDNGNEIRAQKADGADDAAS